MKAASGVLSLICYGGVYFVLSDAGITDQWHYWAILGLMLILDIGQYTIGVLKN